MGSAIYRVRTWKLSPSPMGQFMGTHSNSNSFSIWMIEMRMIEIEMWMIEMRMIKMFDDRDAL